LRRRLRPGLLPFTSLRDMSLRRGTAKLASLGALQAFSSAQGSSFVATAGACGPLTLPRQS
jgi:hypothetical protein